MSRIWRQIRDDLGDGTRTHWEALKIARPNPGRGRERRTIFWKALVSENCGLCLSGIGTTKLSSSSPLDSLFFGFLIVELQFNTHVTRTLINRPHSSHLFTVIATLSQRATPQSRSLNNFGCFSFTEFLHQKSVQCIGRHETEFNLAILKGDRKKRSPIE